MLLPGRCPATFTWRTSRGSRGSGPPKLPSLVALPGSRPPLAVIGRRSGASPHSVSIRSSAAQRLALVGVSGYGRGMNTQERLVLQALRQHADESGKVRGTYSEVRTWLGPEGEQVNVHGVMLNLKKDGHFQSDYFEGGPDGRFSVELNH